MGLFEGIEQDLDFFRPKIYICQDEIAVENVTAMITVEPELIVLKSKCSPGFISIVGKDFRIKEVCEGRILIEGKIHKVEFLQP